MNVLYIIGNGFDKAQGLRTSYPEFYQYLKDNSNNCSDLLRQLKKNIDENTELWADMELALGKFTSQIHTTDDFDNLYFELCEHLQKYLQKQEIKFVPTIKLKNKFIQDLLNPYKYIDSTDTVSLNSFLEAMQDATSSVPFGAININIMSLNYTDTIEKLLPPDAINGSETNSFKYAINDSNYLEQIIHVHGQINDTIIVGVDNAGQIDNEQFRVDVNIQDLLVKEQSNIAMGETRHERCEQLIKNADVIVLYGVSLGETDAHWWHLIGKMFATNDLYIIQHVYKRNFKEVPQTRKQLLGRIKRENRKSIMTKIGFDENEGNWPTDTNKRLFFMTNSNLFKL